MAASALESRVYCSVYGCLNSTLVKPTLSFFKLPADAERRSEWLRLISREDLLHKHPRNYSVCEDHFAEHDILPGPRYKKLKKIALPTLNIPNLHKKDQETQTIDVTEITKLVQTEDALSVITHNTTQTAASHSANTPRLPNLPNLQKNDQETQTIDVTQITKLVQTEDTLPVITNNTTQTAASLSANTPLSELKSKWKTIKNDFLKYKKQKESETLDKPVYDYVWKDHLAFFDHNRSMNALRAKLSAKSPSPSDESDTDSASPVSPTPSTSGARAPTEEHTAKRQRTRSLDDSSINTLIGILGERLEYDDVDHLFKSYAKTFKKLSPRQQAHVKVEMAKLFADAELELVNNEQPVGEVSPNQYLGADIFDVPLLIKSEQ